MYEWDREIDWNKQLYFDDVIVDSELSPVAIPIDLQRLVMEAGANYDFSSIHHDPDVAHASGAPGPFANTFFIIGMFERLLREWMGLQGTITKIGPFRMKIFNCVEEVVTFRAKVKGKNEEDGKGIVNLDIWAENSKGQSVSGEATVMLPKERK